VVTVEASALADVKGLSILVAEDNVINALQARALPTRRGHLPTIAGAAIFQPLQVMERRPWNPGWQHALQVNRTICC
jgi:hypothetical protein